MTLTATANDTTRDLADVTDALNYVHAQHLPPARAEIVNKTATDSNSSDMGRFHMPIFHKRSGDHSTYVPRPKDDAMLWDCMSKAVKTAVERHSAVHVIISLTPTFSSAFEAMALEASVEAAEEFSDDSLNIDDSLKISDASAPKERLFHTFRSTPRSPSPTAQALPSYSEVFGFTVKLDEDEDGLG